MTPGHRIHLAFVVSMLIAAHTSGQSALIPLPCTVLPACSLPWDGTTEPHIVSGVTTYDGHGLPQKVLSLTYDDGPSRPSSATTRALATYLHDQGIRATFFVVTGPHTGHDLWGVCGRPCAGSPSWGVGPGVQPDLPDLSVLSNIAGLGHRIANHTHNHFPLNQISNDDIIKEVCIAQASLDPYVSDGVFLLRPPYGAWDTETLSVSDRLRPDRFAGAAATPLNKIYGPVMWKYSIEAGPGEDYYADDSNCARLGHSPEYCGQRLLDILGDSAAGGAIIFHDWIWNNSPNCPPDLQGNWALRLAQYVVPALKARGYLLLPLDADPAFPGGMLFGSAHQWTSSFSDVDGWGTNLGYYGTFRLGDVNGDQLMDVCARGATGVYCSLSRGGYFDQGYTSWSSLFSNAGGWLPPYHSTTIQLGDVNNDGKDDLCALAAVGVICSISNGASFVGQQLWLARELLPDVIFNDVGYYGTLRLANVVGGNKGKDLCFRAPSGVMCAVNQGTSFGTPTLWSNAFNDSPGGWLPPFYSTTMQLADIDGDGRADVCARGAAGIYCGLSNGMSFGLVQVWSAGTNFSNADFLPSDRSSRYYGTFRVADVNGDGRADACIRSSAGFLCAESLGNRFDSYRVWQKKDFRDDLGWADDRYTPTVMLGDTTGDRKADVCVRGPSGIVCAVAGGATN
jgi:peptidoglycan/xylan/chitin deacetylase (PgdA/CDA1 family)